MFGYKRNWQLFFVNYQNKSPFRLVEELFSSHETKDAAYESNVLNDGKALNRLTDLLAGWVIC
jgi:hypothetical protein